MLQNRIIFITGRKGSGKTTKAAAMAREAYYNNQRVICLAPMSGFDLPGSPYIQTTEQLISPDLYDRSFIAEPGADDLLPRSIFLYCYTAGNLTLFIDEVDIWTSIHDCDENLLNMIRYGRHRGISLVAISQRPANVIRDLTAQADYLIMFQSTENRDVEYLSQRIGRENAEKVRLLNQFDSVTYSAFGGGLVESAELETDSSPVPVQTEETPPEEKKPELSSGESSPEPQTPETSADSI